MVGSVVGVKVIVGVNVIVDVSVTVGVSVIVCVWVGEVVAVAGGWVAETCNPSPAGVFSPPLQADMPNRIMGNKAHIPRIW